jgi:pSer/pThr/pTyr-binding forkhead associated (FHA) protein
MPLRLRVIPPSSRLANEPVTGEQTIDLNDRFGQIRIGRRADLELSLPFSRLSGVHARLIRASDDDQNPDRWLLEDLGSTNGTFVGGERLKPGTKCRMTAGTEIKFAEIKVIFDGEVRGDGPARVQAEGASKDTGRVTGKVQAEASTKNTTSKVLAEVSAKETPSKIPSEASAKSATGKVQGEASTKNTTSKVLAETRSRDTGKVNGHVQGEAPSRDTGKLTKIQGDASIRSGIKAHQDAGAAKPPVNEPTQTYVRGQQSEPVVAATPAKAPVPYLKAVSGLEGGSHTAFRLEQRDHVYMFGRTRRCEFRVETAEVSREHASFTRRSDGIYVNDLGSVNGVLVNNTRVNEYRLFDGDLITIGHIKLRLFDPTETKGRTTDSAVATPSRLAPSTSAESRYEAPPAPRYEPPAAPRYEPPAPVDGSRSDFHPAIAGALAQEGGGETYRPRRPSVRVRLSQSWESSSKFRYAIVIVAASLLAVCAVLVGFKLAG